MIVLRNMAKLPKIEDKDLLLKIAQLYSYESKSGDVINNWMFADGHLYLPPNMNKLQQVAELLDETIVDERTTGKPLKEPFVMRDLFKFRDYQKQPYQQMLDYLKVNYYGMLHGETGSGKTSVATAIMGQFGVKVCVLCDMGSLQSQWKAAVKGVWRKDIQIISSNDKTFADVCVATFQLLNKNRELLKRIKTEFGMVVVDEVHISSASCWKNVLMNIDTKYRLGVSATIYRKGFEEEVLTDLIGPIYVSMKDENKVIPKIKFINTGVKWYSDSPDDFSRTLSKLSKNEQRNQVIINIILQAVKNNRKIAVIAPTIECLKYLHEQTKSHTKGVLYVGSTTLEQDLRLQSDLECGNINVIFSSKKLSKGTDLPRLDCLIMATPSNSKAAVIQIVGRLLRKCEGKPQPVVFDLIDDSSLSKCFARNRKKWYVEAKFELGG